MGNRLALFALCSAIAAGATAQSPTDSLLLSHYRAVSIYRTPQSHIRKAAFPVIDMHSHDYVSSNEGADQWIRQMDSANIETTMILTIYGTAGYDSTIARYGRYPGRFVLWTSFDYTGYPKPGWQKHAVAELERAHRKGMRGVGELGDKGEGENYSFPAPGTSLHIDDPQMKPLLEKCAELHMPVSIHVAEDQWMYEKPDSTNDGLPNAATWHVNMNKPGKLGHDELIRSLENAVRDNPKTTFIACHLANTCSNLDQLGALLDKYPNLFADIAARYGEFSPIPRAAAAFMIRYQDRLVYGTDMDPSARMYEMTFRILESADEHFYGLDDFGYHWALYGLALPKEVLKKIYSENAKKILAR